MCAMANEVSATDLAVEIAHLSSALNPAISASSCIHFHTILLLPVSLHALVARPAAMRRGRTPAQDIHAAGPSPGRYFDFLIDKIVEVRMNPS